MKLWAIVRCLVFLDSQCSICFAGAKWRYFVRRGERGSTGGIGASRAGVKSADEILRQDRKTRDTILTCQLVPLLFRRRFRLLMTMAVFRVAQTQSHSASDRIITSFR